MNEMMATSTQLDNGGDEIVDVKGEQWTEDDCSDKTLVDQGCEGGDGDIDKYKNGCGWDPDSEGKQSTEDDGSERADSGDENQNEDWEQAEESASETADDDQSCDKDTAEEKARKNAEEVAAYMASFSSTENGGREDDDDSSSSCPADGGWKETNDTSSSSSTTADGGEKEPNDSSSSSSTTATDDWNSRGAIWSGEKGYVDKDKVSEENRVKSPAEIKYEELPFRTRHFFLTHALHILEAVCFRTGQRFRKYLEDPDWRTDNLVINPGCDNSDYRRVDVDWLVEDGVQVEWWAYFFYCQAPGMPQTTMRANILESLYKLRCAALHRGDTGGLSFQSWELAMQVPELLEDEVGKTEMADLSEYVLGDGNMDEDVRAAVESKMYTPRLSATKYQLLERIATLLEETCFNLAEREIPEVLEMNGWDCAEKVELNRWIDIFAKTQVVEDCDDLAKDLFPDWDWTVRKDHIISLLHRARMNIRNFAAHRSPVSDEHLVAQVHTGIRIAILQSDWSRAFEIEVVSEMWITSASRGEVLDRLARSYRDGKIESKYEMRRRHELAVFLANEQGKEVEEQEGEQLVSATCNMEEMLWTMRDVMTSSPSMHECLKKMRELVSWNYSQELTEEESKKLLNTSGVGEDSEYEDWGVPLEEPDSPTKLSV